MRQVFLLLLLANVGLAAWSYYGQVEPVQPQSATVSPAPTPSLILVGEAADEVSPPQEEVHPASLPAAPAQRIVAGCYGRDVTEERGKVLAARLRALGAAPRLQEERVERQGYRVYLPAYPSRAAAQEVVRSLQARGVQDYHLVLVGDRRNEISLGVFSTAAAAARRNADLRALGFQPHQDMIGLPARQWVLRAEVPPDASSAGPLLELLRDEGFEGPGECPSRTPA